MTTAIIGAGWLGRAVAAALTVPVLATNRSGVWDGAPPHVSMLALDVTAQFDAGPLTGARSLVIAFAPGLGRATGPQAQALRRGLYVEGTARLLRAMPNATRVVYVGSTSALPDFDGWLDESDPTPADSPRGAVQRDAESIVLSHRGAVVLRMGGLYGPGRELERIYRGAAPSAPRAGDGMAPTNLVHQADAVAAILAALTRPNVRGIVHVVADGHTPRRTMYARVAARTGAAAPTWSEPASAAPRGKRICNHRLKMELGVRLRHPWPG